MTHTCKFLYPSPHSVCTQSCSDIRNLIPTRAHLVDATLDIVRNVGHLRQLHLLPLLEVTLESIFEEKKHRYCDREV